MPCLVLTCTFPALLCSALPVCRNQKHHPLTHLSHPHTKHRQALYCSSEVDPNALRVMETHFPAFSPAVPSDSDDEQEQQQQQQQQQQQHPQRFLHVPLGDVRRIDARMVELIQPDLLIGGSPCQDMSRMNAQGKGLAGPRSQLFFEFVRIRDLCTNSGTNGGGGIVVVLENVVPREEEQVQAINCHMRLASLRLNASEVSAASRDRLYFTCPVLFVC